MKRFLCILITLAMAVSFVLTAFAEGAETSADGFADGLFAFYSGKMNTRNGQDKESKVWEDLAGGHDMTVKINGDNYFTEDGFHLNTSINHFPKEIVDLINSDEFTVEMTLGELESLGTNYNTFINSSNDAFSLFRRCSNDVLEFKFATNTGSERPVVSDGLELFADSTVTITYKVGDKVIVYVDGVNLAEVPCKKAMGADNLFFGHDKTTHNFETVYRGFRFYDRVLTAEEVLKNAKADGTYKEPGEIDPDACPGYVTVAQPVTKIAGDVAFVREINSAEELGAVMAAEVKPSSVIFHVNKNLEVTDGNQLKIADLDEAVRKLKWSVIPVFEISDEETITVLWDYLKGLKFYDCAVMTKSPELMETARKKMKQVRGIIDYTEKYKDSNGLTKEECIELRKNLHTYWGTIALLPENAATKGVVQYLYDSIVNVWIKAPDAPTKTEIFEAVLSGAIGVVSDDTAGFYEATETLMSDTITRMPLNIGHRGLPSSYPENTVEGSLAAYESGADVVELDIYLTKDDKIAVMHDGSTARTCNKSLSVESSTLEQLTALLVNKGFENRDGLNGFHLPSFEDYLKAFKDKDCRLFIEIKGTQAKLVQLMKELIEKYGMYDRCSVITFHESQLSNMRKYYPEMTCGFLCSGYMTEAKADESMKSVMTAIGKYNSTLNPSYSGYGAKSIRAALIRGIGVYPWTFDATGFTSYFTNGYSGLTGNNCDAFNEFPKTLKIGGIEDGKEIYYLDNVELKPTLTTYGRDDVDAAKDTFYTIVEGGDVAKIENGVLSFTAPGDVTIMAAYSYLSSKIMYTVTSEVYKIKATEEKPVEEKKGCGGAAFGGITAIAALAAVALRRRNGRRSFYEGDA